MPMSIQMWLRTLTLHLVRMAWPCGTFTKVEAKPGRQWWSSQGSIFPKTRAWHRRQESSRSLTAPLSAFPVSQPDSWRVPPWLRTGSNFSGSSHTSYSRFYSASFTEKPHKLNPFPVDFEQCYVQGIESKDIQIPSRVYHIPTHACTHTLYTDAYTYLWSKHICTFMCTHIHMAISRYTYYYYILCFFHIIFSSIPISACGVESHNGTNMHGWLLHTEIARPEQMEHSPKSL